MYSSKTVEWETPQKLFDELDKEFHFTLDPCATKRNAKCRRFFTKKENGLEQDWKGVVFMNPPYGREIGQWVSKAYIESLKGAIVVCLLPARTDTKWFHDWIYGIATIRFIKGRLQFGNSKNNAPFPNMIVIFKNETP